MTLHCPFCDVSRVQPIYSGNLVFAIWDRHPVSRGHVLIIPRRHCATWFDATPEEIAELSSAVNPVRKLILERHKPDGFNIGVNVGTAAGQTVDHLHVHVIPRYDGDVVDPTGGVRSVIPNAANYLRPVKTEDLLASRHSRPLICGGDDPLLPHLKAHLDRANAVDIAVAFTLDSGLRYLIEHFRDLLERGGRLRFVTGDYLDVTEPAALFRLLNLQGDVQIRTFETREKPASILRLTSFAKEIVDSPL